MGRQEVVTTYRTHDKYIPITEVTLQSAFTNQPTNDYFEVVSANAGDTQKITVWYTETGSTTLKSETLTLTGATAVSSNSAIVANVYGVFLGDTSGTISKRAVGVITVRKKTGALAITTIAATKLGSGTQMFYLAGRNIELENIAGNTWINAVTPMDYQSDNAGKLANPTVPSIAIATGACLQMTGRMTKNLTVTDYISIASDTTGSTVQITVLA